MNISIDIVKSLALKKARDFLFDITGNDDPQGLSLLVYKNDYKAKKITCIVNCGKAKIADVPADLIVTIAYKELKDK